MFETSVSLRDRKHLGKFPSESSHVTSTDKYMSKIPLLPFPTRRWIDVSVIYIIWSQGKKRKIVI